MEWYFAEKDERRGPIADAEFSDLMKNGRITPTTQVWRAGWNDWRELRFAGDLTGDLTSPDGAGTALCVECHRSFPTTEMVQYSGSWVCPTCKPIFFQKVKEGIEPTAAMDYGGFWIRFLAKFIDGIILGIVGYLLQLPFLALTRDPNKILVGAIAGWLLSFSARAAYTIILTGKYGATVGKMACGLRVVTANGYGISYGLAAGRFFAEILSGILLCIGYIMAAFDEEKRTLHDRICNTRVIRSRG